MAEAAIGFALQKLGVLLIQETIWLSGVRDEFEWLRTELRWMESFLKDANSKIRQGDERAKNWVKEVRAVAYDAEDIVDLFVTKIEKRRTSCLPFELKALHGLGSEIARIRSRIRAISESRQAYGIVDLGERKPDCRIDARRRQVSHRLDDDVVVVGFDVHEKLIVECLLDSHVERRRCVISIVGMGGLGKTTLATKVYNSSRIKLHFHSACVWISVSQDYSLSDLLKNITKKVVALTDEEIGKLERTEEEELRSNLYGILKDRRYLIVMDDIWGPEVWEQIKSALPNANNGSRVLLTTRFVEVAKYADAKIEPYELPLLSQEESWELFLMKVFCSTKCPTELEELGKVLVSGCSGLPLAVVVLAGLLSIKDPTYTAWREVADSVSWESTRDGKECLQILALSYNDLSDYNLKSCFAYIGSFPEDAEIKTSVLIKLWVAEDFVPQKEKQTMEETAMIYVNEMIQRCMIQVVERDLVDGSVRSFKIHDLFRDLCISVAKEDGFLKIYRRNNYDEEHHDVAPRRLVLYDKVDDYKIHSFTAKPRTLLCFNLDTRNRFLRNVLHRFEFLRVIYLNMPSSGTERQVPKEITGLVHLRYLRLMSYDLRRLPSSMGSLCNLQTLDVSHTLIEGIPATLWTIQTLRHVTTTRRFSIRSSSSGIGSLRNLQTLERVIAGRWIGRDLAKLSSLRKLGITGISETQQKTLCDSINSLDHITSLYLHSFNRISATLITSLDKHQRLCQLTLRGQWTDLGAVPKNILSLSLQHCELDQDSMSALGMLTRLTVLKLKSCRLLGEELGFSTGGFPKLRHLQIRHVYMMKHWKIEEGAMPNLTHLTINNQDLEAMPDGLEHMVSLEKLVMFRMPLSLLDKLRERGEEWHKIRHIPSVAISETANLKKISHVGHLPSEIAYKQKSCF